MNNLNSFFSSDDEETSNNDELELDLKEDKDLLFDDSLDDDDDLEGEKELEINKTDKESEKETEEDDVDGGDEKEEENKESPELKDSITLSKSKIILIKKLLQSAKESNDKVIELLSVFSTEENERVAISQIGDEMLGKIKRDEEEDDDEGNIVEGVFDGENMIGPDGKQYTIPANYASKSKLVEGDILKLTILNNGTFIYKQIGPIDRDRIVGILEKGSSGQFVVTFEGRKWRVLTASVTYFKGNVGDEVIILVPKNADSQWAAVDNIVRNKSL